jgi:perosamine synthetase
MILDVIPRFALPYGPGDVFAAVVSLFNDRIPAPVPFRELFGDGAYFWTGSGRQALWLTLKALGLKSGAGVAISLFNDLSISSAVAGADCRPVYVDVEERTLSMDSDSLAAARGRFEAVVVGHLFGNVADLNRIRDAAGPVPLIEDTVHAPLSHFDGRDVGQFGVACFHSFASTKYWPAGGGGLLVVRDRSLADRVGEEVRHLHRPSPGDEWKNLFLQVAKAIVFSRTLYGTAGLPFRTRAEARAFLEPALNRKQIHRHQAAVAIRQASRFRERVERQRRNSLYLLSLLDKAEGIVLPREQPGTQYNYHLFTVLVSDAQERDAIASAMLKQGIDTSRIWHDIVPHCRRLGYTDGCPVSESVPERMMTLPNYASLSPKDIERVAKAFLFALRHYRSRSHARTARLPVGTSEPS